MKRTRLLAALAIAMVAGLLVTGCKSPMGLTPDANIAWHWAPGPQVFTLWAGQNQNAGNVSVWNTTSRSPDTLYIKYQTTGNWWIEETHAHVALTLLGIPHSNGGPIPGHFEFQDSWNPRVQTCTYAIPFRYGWNEGVDLYIATHAIVVELDGNGKVKQRQTGWGGDNDFPGHNWAKYIKYTFKKAYKDVDLPEDSVTMAVVNNLLQTLPVRAYFQVTLSGVPGDSGEYDVWNGIWRGWCLQLHADIVDTHEYRVKLYSSQDPDLPTYLQNPMYDNINYLLNNKDPSATVGEIQKAIWYLMGDYGTNLPSSLKTKQMIHDALLHGDGWHPGPDQWVAVLADSPEHIQLVAIEVDP